MAEGLTCPRCGTELAPESAQGLCPRCLIALNLSCPTEAPTGCEPAGSENRACAAVAPPPEELAQYFPELEILQLLGRGGMGAVYKARQRRLNRLVALKILPPTVGQDAAFAERFTREAQALAKLNHPHIVTLYEFGQAEGLFYFLMEYVDGMNLRELVNVKRLSSAEALAIVGQVCDALQYAHEQGIVHRDIKPENLLLNKEGQVKIADFGVAKLIAEGAEEPAGVGAGLAPEAGLTHPRGLLGTPQYMAPEQVARPLEVDHRADIYSLGVVFYQMLTGELPTGKFEPPSKKVVIDVRLDQVVLRALEKQPERRYQRVSEVKHELGTILETVARPSSSATPAEPAAAPSRPRAAAVPRLLLAAAGALLLCGFLWWLNYASPHQGRTARFVAPNTWEPRAAAELLKGRSTSVAVWTGEEMVVFGGEGLNVSFGDGARYSLAKDLWSSLPLEGAAPSARTCASGVWTGSELIVWGGFGGMATKNINRNDGARFAPTHNAWEPVSTQGAPVGRFYHSALWTGEEMLVWGGFSGSRAELVDGKAEACLNTGGGYRPATDTWREISHEAAPAPRFFHAAVWTGTEMIVWGGGNGTEALGDGACYNPVTDTWKPMRRDGAPKSRIGPVTVWTGTEMIVWGGSSRSPADTNCFYFQDGARYNPETDTWRPLSSRGAPKGRVLAQAVWTGREMVLWGGVNDAQASGLKDPSRYLGTGARYNPATDTWSELPEIGAPTPRLAGATVWTGEGLLMFGGYNGKHLNDTYYFSLKK